MNSIEIRFKNCFGIKELNHTFDFTQSNIVVVYAPNGVMKSSFARTFELIRQGKHKEIRDRISGEAGSAVIRIDQAKLDRHKHGEILVVDGEELMDSSESVSRLLFDDAARKQVDARLKELKTSFAHLIDELKSISKDEQCARDIISAFPASSGYEALAKLCGIATPPFEAIAFPYRSIFDEQGKIARFIEANGNKINNYIRAVKRILSKSRLFGESSDAVFDSERAEALFKSIDGSGFFQIGHALSLKGNYVLRSETELRECIDNELARLSKDVEKCKEMRVLDKRLAANQELREFKKTLIRYPWIATRLLDYEGFRKAVWSSYISQVGPAREAYLKCFEALKNVLAQNGKRTLRQLKSWEEVVDEFTSRFFPPFSVNIENVDSVLLGENIPARLAFSYSSDGGNRPLEVDALQEILSRGEARALRLMQVIFELKAREKSKSETLLVLDDVVDSFDYRNKYAMAEYIKDISDSGKFKIIVLTHNYDFFRLVTTRLWLKSRTFPRGFLVKNANGKVSLNPFGQECSVFKTWMKQKTPISDVQFLAAIPFVRNIAEYARGLNSCEYKTLTACLHIKTVDSNADDLKLGDIESAYQGVLSPVKHGLSLSNSKMGFNVGSSYLDCLYSVAGKICNTTAAMDSLEEFGAKMVLSIATRLKVENYLFGRLGDDEEVEAIEINQTGNLIKRYMNTIPAKERGDKTKVLTRLQVVTPEYIHVNSFMYESLIDTGIDTLIDLYRTVSKWELPPKESK